MVARRRLAVLALAAALATLGGGATDRRLVPERVTFDSLDRDPATGAPVRIAALLFRPQGTSDVRSRRSSRCTAAAACTARCRSRRDDLSLRHQAMAELLVGRGLRRAVPGQLPRRAAATRSARSRPAGARSPRRTGVSTRRARSRSCRRAPTSRPTASRVLGWSHGGSAVLAALDARQPTVAAMAARACHRPYFRAGVAFYPGCVGVAPRAGTDTRWRRRCTIFIAGRDDWTAPGPCVELPTGCRLPASR